jgi:hypothetical protein
MHVKKAAFVYFFLFILFVDKLLELSVEQEVLAQRYGKM